MNGKRLRAAAPVLALCIAAGGCMVTSSKYEMKTKEADTLRDAVAATNKEKNALEARNEALTKQLADEKEAQAALGARVQAQQAEIRRMSEDLASTKKSYEGTRITREEFISELLEKEKATGKRIQSLSERAQACETALAGRPGDSEALKRERDILLGRVERLAEERAQEEKRRDERFAALSDAIGKVSRDVTVTPLGPALRVDVPEKVLFRKETTTLSESGKKAIALAGKTAGEFPAASILVSTRGKKTGEEIRAVLGSAGKIPEDRIRVTVYEKEKGAVLLLLVP